MVVTYAFGEGDGTPTGSGVKNKFSRGGGAPARLEFGNEGCGFSNQLGFLHCVCPNAHLKALDLLITEVCRKFIK